MTPIPNDLPFVRVERAVLPNGSHGYRLLAEMVIPKSVERVFAFFSNTDNLGAITPPWVNFRVLRPEGEGPVEMRAGAMIDYRISLHGVPMRWRSQITTWEPPHRFVDEQRKGPYRVWTHEHRFRAISQTETHMTDEVFYSHLGGPLIHRFFVKPDLIKIFKYRQLTLDALMSKMT